MKKKSPSLTLRISMLSLSLFSIATPVFAANIGTVIGKAVENAVNGILPAVLLCVGGYFLVTRDWMKMISFMGIAILIAIFTNWTWVKGLGEKVYNSFLL